MARGEIVVVNERYGVRISEVTRPEEKIGERKQREAAMQQQQQMAQTAESAGKAAPAMKVLQDGAANLSDEDKQALIQQFAGGAA